MSVNVRTVVLAVGAVYVVALAAMFAYGWGIPASYLARPGWYLVASPFFAMASFVPGTMDLLGWQTWNVLLLVLSGSLNVFAAYWVAKVVERDKSDVP